MPDPLVLPCAAVRLDKLKLEPGEKGTGEATLLLLTLAPDQAEELNHYLDKDSARQLFNYLGVWLHQFGS